MTWAVLSEARSENLVECLFARKRKSGPSRWRCHADKLALLCSCLFIFNRLDCHEQGIGRSGR